MTQRFSRSTMVVGNKGIGNGLMMIPILRTLEARGISYYHMYDELYSTEFVKNCAFLKNIQGIIPDSWRRFSPYDWEPMIRFMENKNINLLFNFRLEDPNLDSNYFEFKKLANKRGIDCWSLHECGRGVFDKPLALGMIDLVEKKMGTVEDYNKAWLTETRDNTYKKKLPIVSFYLGASQPIKRWKINSWCALGCELIRDLDCNLQVFSGITDQEKSYAHTINNNIRKHWPQNVHFYSELDMLAVVNIISRSDLVVSHDTWVSHLCAALGVPLFSLYIATNGVIWQPLSNTYLKCFQSDKAMTCKQMKIDGTCKNYYNGCAASCSDGIDVRKVYKEIIKWWSYTF